MTGCTGCGVTAALAPDGGCVACGHQMAPRTETSTPAGGRVRLRGSATRPTAAVEATVSAPEVRRVAPSDSERSAPTRASTPGPERAPRVPTPVPVASRSLPRTRSMVSYVVEVAPGALAVLAVIGFVVGVMVRACG